MKRSLTAFLLAGSIASLSATPGQDPPPKRAQVSVNLIWADTRIDLWEELRQIDPAFKALGAEVARIGKGLESDEIATRSKAAADLKALGLTAYGPIKEARDKATAPGLRTELDAVLTSLVGEMGTSLPTLPGARRVGAKEAATLKARIKELKIDCQQPMMSLMDGLAGEAFVGETVPLAHKRRVIHIDGNGTSARLEKEGHIVKRGILIRIVPKVLDPGTGAVSLDITATSQGMGGSESMEVTARLAPTLKATEGFLAGPFPAAEEKENPWWFYVECAAILP